MRSAVSREPGWLDLKIVSSAIIGTSLSISQTGSSSELSEALLLLTSSRPQIWTEDYAGKTTASKRLCQYIQKGSQGGPANFWTNIDKLLRIIPREVIAGTDKSSTDDTINISSAISLTEAFVAGLNSREEPRQNLTAGWKSYTQIGAWLVILLPQTQRAEFIDTRLFPLVAQYVRSNPESAQWKLPSQSAESICSDYLSTLISLGQARELRPLWTKLSNELLEAVQLSSPQLSKDFQSSQDFICAEAKRFFALQAAVLSRVSGTESEPQVQEIFESTSSFLLENCLQVLHARNGKPYGAAAVVEECVQKMPSVAQVSQDFLIFVQADASDLLFSPSANHLISIILACRGWSGFASSFESFVGQALEMELQQSNAHILQTLLKALDLNEVKDKEKVNLLIMRALHKACSGSHFCWPIVAAVLQNQTSRGEFMDNIFLFIVDSLSVDDKVFDALHGLSYLGKTVPSAVKEFQNGLYGSRLIGKLLYLIEAPSEDLATMAEILLAALKETVVGETSHRSKVEILHDGFSRVTEESLS